MKQEKVEKIIILSIQMLLIFSLLLFSILAFSIGYKECLEETSSISYCSTIGVLVEADKKILFEIDKINNGNNEFKELNSWVLKR